jgi:hypothetical protein
MPQYLRQKGRIFLKKKANLKSVLRKVIRSDLGQSFERI